MSPAVKISDKQRNVGLWPLRTEPDPCPQPERRECSLGHLDVSPVNSDLVKMGPQSGTTAPKQI